MRWILALLLVVALAPQGTAQPVEPPWAEDIAQINDCLDAQTKEVDAWRTCIGAITRDCGNALGEGAGTTAASVLCANREERAWRAVLDQLATRLRANETPTQLALLDQALDQGEDWSRARCAYEASIYEGGSLSRVVAAYCVRDTSAERAIDLYARFAEN